MSYVEFERSMRAVSERHGRPFTPHKVQPTFDLARISRDLAAAVPSLP